MCAPAAMRASMLFVVELLLFGVGVAFLLADQELARARCQARCGSGPQDCSRRRASGAFAIRLRCAAVRAHLWHCHARRAWSGVVRATNWQRTSLVR